MNVAMTSHKPRYIPDVKAKERRPEFLGRIRSGNLKRHCIETFASGTSAVAFSSHRTRIDARNAQTAVNRRAASGNQDFRGNGFQQAEDSGVKCRA